MSYCIHITSAAERDLNRAADHMEFVLKNPKAADDLLDEAEKQINSLSKFPKKFQLVDDPFLISKKQLECYSSSRFLLSLESLI